MSQKTYIEHMFGINFMPLHSPNLQLDTLNKHNLTIITMIMIMVISMLTIMIMSMIMTTVTVKMILNSVKCQTDFNRMTVHSMMQRMRQNSGTVQDIFAQKDYKN